ncbi:Putative threonine efflux protein [Roseovarius mucosus DSM 17069]|jgi:threonine/homoserine/homoserine lactone efflux protein|uniref:Putative threonine efflux protein n=1 Tax=Roseovarius mucosus DSM 17069 TaxID=1288298 RepID=A0A0A0HME7_9RHOB|nr:LysE family translocator [Roseovarius mucosus]KGM88987.1 Putative threonine efflux protein [Roseovarius mucosus DSM 17069]MAN98233.1 LysE family translocator [Roseovarius sp.]|tara:strand:- start:987 stop:1583 length:597 start_codon:yes stop_codon:yes gene_type:complete
MTLDLLTALATFAFVTVMTPGPNNLMLMASGTNFGFTRSIPHMLGIGLGFPLMVACVGLGVMQVFDLWPLSYTLLKIGSVAYLVYLAWKIANAAPPRDAEASGKPLTFLQSAAFQWVNPKAWSMALSAITLYATGRDLASVLWVAGVYVVVSSISTTSWTLLGQQLRRLLKNQTRLRIFNWLMATLLIATLIPVLWPS